MEVDPAALLGVGVVAIAGAVVKILGLCREDSMLQAIKEGVPIKPEDNAAAAKEAYDLA